MKYNIEINHYTVAFTLITIYDFVSTYLFVHYHTSVESNLLVNAFGWIPSITIKVILSIVVLALLSNNKIMRYEKLGFVYGLGFLIVFFNSVPAMQAIKIILGYG